jgi:hypothetical protein
LLLLAPLLVFHLLGYVWCIVLLGDRGQFLSPLLLLLLHLLAKFLVRALSL